MLSLLTFHNNKIVTIWIRTGISSEKIKPFDTNLEPTMSNLANDIVILKSKNSILVKTSSLLYTNVILNLHIVYELNDRPHSPFKNVRLEIVYLVQSN